VAKKDKFKEKIGLSAFLLFLVLATGTIGYTLIEGWSLFDSFYMTLITLTTIGYTEVHSLSKTGRFFNVSLIIVGLGVVAYTANNLIRFVLEGEIQKAMGRRKMEKMIHNMRDHYIICGYGRMGSIICRELKSNSVPFVVIEKEPVELDADDDTLIIPGDATNDELLKEAKIDVAKGLISVLSTDADNLYVVLSARGLNSQLQIVVRAGDEGAEIKLLRAGADRVISPYHIGGLSMAHSVLKPSVVEFMEVATRGGNLDLQMEEVVVHQGSKYAGLELDKCKIGSELGIIIVAIKKAEGMKFNPTSKTVIDAGDTLIALGEWKKLKRLEEEA
jgi:voltage-gated potassium channel